MAKSIAKRVADSFDNDDSRDKLPQYLEWLQNAIANYSQNLSRLATLMILLIAAFELVSDSSGLQISIGSFKISRGSTVLEFLPCLVSYLYFEIIVDSRKIVSKWITFTETFKIWSPTGEQNDLDLMVLPSLPLYWNPAVSRGHYELRRPSDKVEYWTANGFQYLILVGVITFQAQAYYLLYNSSRVVRIAWYISAIITIFCLSSAVIHFFIDTFIKRLSKWRLDRHTTS